MNLNIESIIGIYDCYYKTNSTINNFAKILSSKELTNKDMIFIMNNAPDVAITMILKYKLNYMIYKLPKVQKNTRRYIIKTIVDKITNDYYHCYQNQGIRKVVYKLYKMGYLSKQYAMCNIFDLYDQQNDKIIL